MSRGPGRIERAIRELFDANPDRAFFTADLVRVCFGYAPGWGLPSAPDRAALEAIMRDPTPVPVDLPPPPAAPASAPITVDDGTAPVTVEGDKGPVAADDGG